jgi:hypothetical protein
MVHLTGVDIIGTAADSSLSNVFTISGIGFKKACVKKETFLNVAGQRRAKNKYALFPSSTKINKNVKLTKIPGICDQKLLTMFLLLGLK